MLTYRLEKAFSWWRHGEIAGLWQQKRTVAAHKNNRTTGKKLGPEEFEFAESLVPTLAPVQQDSAESSDTGGGGGGGG